MLRPWDVLFDALHFAAKANPQKKNGSWPVGAALVPQEVRKCDPEVTPSEAAALLAFAGKETMRLHLPAVAPTRAVVDTVCDTISEALMLCTPTEESQQLVPISTAHHENGQLCWSRVSATHPTISVPLCRYGEHCDAHCLEHAPGCLPVYLTPREQDEFDKTGVVPPMAMFCLLCIRRDAQAMYMLHTMTPVNSQVDLGRPTLVVPPFQNIVNAPGGYRADVLGVPPSEKWACNVSIVGVSNQIKVAYDAHGARWHVDQSAILYGNHLNDPAASVPSPRAGRGLQAC